MKFFERISDLEEGYCLWAQYEKGRMSSTVEKHKYWIRDFRNIVGDIPIRQIKQLHFDEVKQFFFKKNLSRSRVASVIYAMKGFLMYCHDVKGCKILDLDKIKVPPQKRDYVVHALSKNEIQRMVEDIGISNEWLGRKKKRNINIRKLRWKCFLEVMWSSGMRRLEVLSMNRNTLNLDRNEATIIGKGGKVRTVFVSDRACALVKEYLEVRNDDDEALFVSHCGDNVQRWSPSAAQNYLERWRTTVDLSGHITFHVLRKSFGSLIFYEKDIYTASELLGHANIETTKRHYICKDWSRLRDIHRLAIEGV